VDAVGPIPGNAAAQELLPSECKFWWVKSESAFLVLAGGT
jgi:hypothetical protein